MSIEIHAISQIQVATESSFGSLLTFPGSDFSSLAVVEGSAELVLDTEMLNPETLQQYTDAIPTRVLGEDSCTLSFTTIAAATGTLSGDNTAATVPNAGKLYKAALGGENLAKGDFCTAATNAQVFKLRSSDAAGRKIIGGAGINVNGNFASVVIATAAAVDQINVRMALAATPANGDIIRPAATYYLSDTESTLQFGVTGAENSDRWQLAGMYLESMEFEFPIGQLPRINWTWKGVRWANSGNGSIQSTSPANFSAIMNVGEFQMQVVGTQTRAEVDIQTFEATPAVNYIPIRSQNNSVPNNATIGVVRGRSGPAISWAITLPYQDLTYFTARDDKTLYALQYVCGLSGDTSSAAMVAIDIPRSQIVNVQRVDQDGIASQRVEGIAQLDQLTDTTNGAELARSAFRWHVIS